MHNTIDSIYMYMCMHKAHSTPSLWNCMRVEASLGSTPLHLALPEVGVASVLGCGLLDGFGSWDRNRLITGLGIRLSSICLHSFWRVSTREKKVTACSGLYNYGVPYQVCCMSLFQNSKSMFSHLQIVR